MKEVKEKEEVKKEKDIKEKKENKGKKGENGENDWTIYIKLYPKVSLDEKKFYNIGAANWFHHKYWTNIHNGTDYYLQESLKHDYLYYDITQKGKLPIESDSAEIVYCANTIQYINEDSTTHLFKEIYRILKEGSIFRLTAPDISILYRAVKRKDNTRFIDYENLIKNDRDFLKDSTIQLFLLFSYTQLSKLYMDANPDALEDHEFLELTQGRDLKSIMEILRKKAENLKEKSDNPKNWIIWYDKERMIKLLKECGFKDIIISGFGQSVAPILRNTNFFDKTNSQFCFYLDAVK